MKAYPVTVVAVVLTFFANNVSVSIFNMLYVLLKGFDGLCVLYRYFIVKSGKFKFELLFFVLFTIF